MATLFISYRRDDWSPARLLNAHLEQHFDVFLDVDDIAPGETFPDRLRAALADCKVCFVVIGPGWISERNLARLNLPGDWVCEELSSVLQGAGVRTIPLLVGGAQLPKAEQLPEVLRPLLARNAVTLSHEKWDQECDHLIEQIPAWLSQPLMRSRERPLAPSVLPYLCDRVEQADDVLYSLDAPAEAVPNTYIFTLPGHKWEGHEGLLERLTFERIFEGAFNADQTGVAMRPLEWNRDQAKRGQYDILLRRAIKRGAMQLPAASDEALLRFLREAIQPMVFVLQITEEDLDTLGTGLLPGLTAAWRALFKDHAPARAMVLWINLSYDDTPVAIDQLPGALTPLAPITEGHIRAWMGRDQVKPFATGQEARLLALTENAQLCCATGKLHMLRFAEAVQEILV